MAKLEFYAVSHSKMDSLNRGISSIHQKINLLTSFPAIYKNPTKKIELPKNRNKLMIDSGAYDVLIRRGNEDYPFSPKKYASHIKNMEVKPNIVVSMDYICSPDGGDANLELISKTIQNALILKKEFNDIKDITFMPVVQGYCQDEYIHCVREMVKSNVIQEGDYIGIGSLAARKKIKEPRLIIRSIYNYLSKCFPNFKLHCFGLNLNILKDKEIFNMIDSIDSLAWTFPYRFGRVKMFTRERIVEANTNGSLKEPEFYYLSLIATLKYIEFLNLRFRDFESSKIINLPINDIIDNKQKFGFYLDIIRNTGLRDIEIRDLKKVNQIINLLIKYKDKFPRETDLIIDKIPTYTSKKFLFLNPNNTKIGKFEFLYLLLSSLENAYLDFNNNGGVRNLISLLKKFYSNLQSEEFGFKAMIGSLKFLNIDKDIEDLFLFKSITEISSEYYKSILEFKNKIELKRYNIKEDHLIKQKRIADNKFKDEIFIVI